MPMEVATEASSEVAWDVAPAGEDAVGPPPDSPLLQQQQQQQLHSPSTPHQAESLLRVASRARNARAIASRKSSSRRLESCRTLRLLCETQAAAAASSRPDVYQLKGFASKRDETTASASASDDDNYFWSSIVNAPSYYGSYYAKWGNTPIIVTAGILYIYFSSILNKVNLKSHYPIHHLLKIELK